jgi:tetratricopeptide (TPR) repeat protein
MPVTLHNYRADGGFILVAANGGINFYLGNEPGAGGETPLPPGLRWQAAVQAPLREGHLSLSSQDRYWWSEAGKSIAADPVRWLGLLARKALFFLNARESSNNKDLPYFTGQSPVTRYYRWWFGILFCLAAGAMASTPRAAGTLRLASLFTGCWAAVTIFFVTARYRLPLVPFVAIPASAFLAGLPRLLRSGRRKLRLPAVAVPLAALAVFPPWFGYGGRQIDHDFQMGQILLMRGEAEGAERHLIRALGKKGGEQADILNSLGAARFAEGDLEGAERHYLAALFEGEFSEVWFNLGVVYEAMGPSRKGEALRAYRRALEINPLERRAAANRDHLLRQNGSPGN